MRRDETRHGATRRDAHFLLFRRARRYAIDPRLPTISIEIRPFADLLCGRGYRILYLPTTHPLLRRRRHRRRRGWLAGPPVRRSFAIANGGLHRSGLSVYVPRRQANPEGSWRAQVHVHVPMRRRPPTAAVAITYTQAACRDAATLPGPDTRLLSSFSLSPPRCSPSLYPSYASNGRTKAGEIPWGPRGVRTDVSLSLRICRARTTAAVARRSEQASRTVIIHSREPNIRRHTFASGSHRWTEPTGTA
ncbi:hypothetical protein PUN28_009401 [Cardiocondyla obscurior]|uniref:Uncharacterized protein n=1 Tax=Cardiocondyla obscurior TaxID=286306 RepID=A0AAW2FV77_9HYME